MAHPYSEHRNVIKGEKWAINVWVRKSRKIIKY